ncbi:MAG: PIG-L family deacetylase [Bacteroidetes bacterium]|nr:PIG-L family deacetylase [Bacteroidota bacterium]
MRILYIFPHPDDESFGPAAVMHRQLRAGHEVHLLTWTRGGATKQRHRLGLSIEEMGDVRFQEMLSVERTLGLTSMTVWDYPDSGLKEMDPRELERATSAYMKDLRPDVIVTYAVHGISGFHDHLVAHAVVKRLFVALRDEGADWPRRLALLTLEDSGAPVFRPDGFRLKHSTPEDIDCIVPLDPADIAIMKSCLACYETYKDTIEESGIVEKVGTSIPFEFYRENSDPPVDDLFTGLS